jgi:hypothetical protein
MAAAVREPSELWELEDYLTQRRKEINRKYDDRASNLTFAFGTLLPEGRITEETLRGLSVDKLESIRRDVDFLRRRDEPV